MTSFTASFGQVFYIRFILNHHHGPFLMHPKIEQTKNRSSTRLSPAPGRHPNHAPPPLHPPGHPLPPAHSTTSPPTCPLTPSSFNITSPFQRQLPHPTGPSVRCRSAVQQVPALVQQQEAALHQLLSLEGPLEQLRRLGAAG